MAIELENRLISFASLALAVSDHIKRSESGKHLRSQLIRSATSVALNFGEARSSESAKDLQHKFSLILKELRESYVNLKLLKMNNLCNNASLLESALDENNQLIAIFVKSIQTVKRRIRTKPKE